MTSDALRDNDLRRLKELFYRSFDRSRLEALLKLPDARLDREAAFLGQGTHFRAWRLRPEPPGAPCLVLKRAISGLTGPEGLGQRRWADAMRKLKGLGSLVPPFEVLETDGRIGIVMPYGDQALEKAAPHWLPMQSRLQELDRALAARGLVLQDIPQGRSLGGIPFLYDLSDIYTAGE